MDISKAEGTLSLDTTTNEKICNISLRVPQQTMYLRSYRIEFDTAAHALAAQICYLDAPFLSGNQLIDTNPANIAIPLLLDNSIVTHAFGKSIPIYLSSDIPRVFPIRLLDTNFTPIANLVRATIVFSLTQGSLV